MIVKNVQTGRIISRNCKQANSIKDRLFGLLDQSNPRSLFFKTRFGIHTFFLKDPIDVVVLDSGFKVVGLKENLRPNRVFFWNPRFSLILELEQGTINCTKISLGDKLGFLLKD